MKHALNLKLDWQPPERGLTGLTARILAVNAFALFLLALGILYLGHYQNRLIEQKLRTFESQLALIATALGEEAQDGHLPAQDIQHKSDLFARQIDQRLVVFDLDKNQIADTHARAWPPQRIKPQPRYQSIQTLRNMAGFAISLVPEKRTLPPDPLIVSEGVVGTDFPGLDRALEGVASVAAWQGPEDSMTLSAAMPLRKDGQSVGALILIRAAPDIEDEIKAVWLNILRIFGLSLVMTFFLSVYFSGTLVGPLKKLARAAEAVRRGQSDHEAIPDFSARHDEIGELSVAFRAMTQALQTRLDSIERFAADVAHELKNPLSSLRSAAQTLPIVKKKADREKLYQVIEHDVARLDRLITDIAAASRLDTALNREAIIHVDLGALLSGVCASYADPLKNDDVTGVITGPNNVQIVLSAEGQSSVTIEGIEDRLGQVVRNILDNALSFSPPGGQIKITYGLSGNYGYVSFEDQGPGIPENRLDQIFTRFYSDRPAHESYGQHSGLGLSICQQIVSSLGGRIVAENRRERSGARFIVFLKRV